MNLQMKMEAPKYGILSLNIIDDLIFVHNPLFALLSLFRQAIQVTCPGVQGQFVKETWQMVWYDFLL